MTCYLQSEMSLCYARHAQNAPQSHENFMLTALSYGGAAYYKISLDQGSLL